MQVPGIIGKIVHNPVKTLVVGGRSSAVQMIIL